MSPQLPIRQTAYAEYVNSNLTLLVRERGGLYNYLELAEMVGLKPTHNFRRRVKALVAVGTLKSHSVFTPRGGIEVRFSAPEGYLTEIPF